MSDTFESWGIVELMGHVRLGGRITEEERFGSKVGRIDVPTADGGFVTRYFTAGSIYSLTVTSEEAARAVAAHNRVRPVHQFELPKPAAASTITDRDDNNFGNPFDPSDPDDCE